MEQTEAMKELKSLLSYKSYSGFLYYASMLGILLAVIGLVCPFCSYNPTILEETKHTLQSWNLSLPIKSGAFNPSLFVWLVSITVWMVTI